MKLTFTERKALLQLRENPFISPVAVKSARSMSLIRRLEEKGLIAQDEEEFAAYTLTDLGHSALEAK